jgi:hypothetical protein
MDYLFLCNNDEIKFILHLVLKQKTCNFNFRLYFKNLGTIY